MAAPPTLASPRRFPGLARLLRAFLQAGLMLDPWLAGLRHENFEFRSQELLADDAAKLAAEHWREPLISQTLGTYPLSHRFGETAAREVLVSTAATIAHERRGTLHIAEAEAMEAMQRVRAFITAHGFGTLVVLYGAITFVENHVALRHYCPMSEQDFVEPLLHRPWAPYTLDDELLVGLVLGTVRLEVRDGRRCVLETPRGERAAARLRGVLERAGYLERRLQLIYLSQFNLFQDWDTQVAAMAPDALGYRRAFTAFIGLTPGAKVLEVGCGMATQTFEGGLWDAVGPAGQITGLDPAAGMLARARAKAEQRGAANIAFVAGRAERLDFPTSRFDAAVGMSFLHFTDAPKALGELRRVTRPGGVVAVGGPCQYAPEATWFADWFRPILDLARQHGRDAASPLLLPGRLPETGEQRQWFLAAGLTAVEVQEHTIDWALREPDVSVAFMIQGVSFFQRELELLPWQARQDLIEELKRRGERVCRETVPEQRTLQWPLEFVKGVVPAS